MFELSDKSLNVHMRMSPVRRKSNYLQMHNNNHEQTISSMLHEIGAVNVRMISLLKRHLKRQSGQQQRSVPSLLQVCVTITLQCYYIRAIERETPHTPHLCVDRRVGTCQHESTPHEGGRARCDFFDDL